MALNVNSVILGGNLTRDPELRVVGQSTVCGFGLAINHRWKDKSGEKCESTTFVDCECWEQSARFLGQYANKGSCVLVEGELRLEQWEDKAGNRRSKLKVRARNVQLAGPAGGSGSSGGRDTRETQRYTKPASSYQPAGITDNDAQGVGGGDDEPPF